METIKKVFYWLVVPAILIFILIKFLIDRDVATAIKSLMKTIGQDHKDEKEQQELVDKANALKVESDTKGKELGNKESDENWHKRK
jgi:hypothetical protein